ncbi:helix-turn-helix transcriptional regulator [Streptantibioticus parmotrematis]|uniref:helix-turn-helix domain-containing protein n=1 Tax=Streptantibioticus parmotrematis TaxID=2873249 RepID=UPI0033CD18E2
MDAPLDFGSELRSLRQKAGYSLTRFAGAIRYHKSYISKLERGQARPSLDLARRCDALLRTSGRLERLVEQGSSYGSSEGDGSWPKMKRRAVLLSGAGTLVTAGLSDHARTTHLESAAPAVDLFREELRHMRQLGQCTAPTVLLPLLAAQTRTITTLAAGCGAMTRTGLLVLAARFAEYAGWMAQEAGETRAADSWLAEAVDLAEAGGDHHLAAYAYVRRGLVTLYDGNAVQTVALAGTARRPGLPDRIRGLAAQREAQGHGLAGDERACLHALDQARELLVSAENGDSGSGSDEPVLGTSNIADPASMTTGWCLYDLGRPVKAAEALDRQCPLIPATAVRCRARYGMRRALAHAAAGEIDHACTIAIELLPLLTTVSSATIRTDVRRLARELGRFRTHRAVLDLQPALARALSPVLP